MRQTQAPYGYSETIAGLFVSPFFVFLFGLAKAKLYQGGSLIIAGLVAAIITAPIFDRYLTHHLVVAIRIGSPIISIGWFSLIWAGMHSPPILQKVLTIADNLHYIVKENNTGALFAIFVVIGVVSLILLPCTLELASEVTRNSATSSAVLWASGNLFPFIFIIGIPLPFHNI